MRVVLSTYDSRGGVEPLVALAVRLRQLGAEVRVCAPPDEEFGTRLTGAGVTFVPVGPPVRPLVTAAAPAPADVPGRAAQLIGEQFDKVTAAAEGCDVLLATGLLPVAAGVRSVAEKLGLRYVYASYQAVTLPSPHHPPHPRPGRPLPPDVTDNRTLWKLDAESANALFGEALNSHRAAFGLAPVADVRGYAFTERPWLAADPVLDPWPGTDLDVVQTGAWVAPDDRPLPADVEAFLGAGPAPVYAGFGSMPLRGSADAAAVVIEAIRAQGRRAVVSEGWAALDLIDDRGDCLVVGEANHQALFPRVAAVVHHGGAGTTTTAARSGVPQVVVPQQAVDQTYWAARVADLGIGAAHDGPVPTVESLSAALATALDPATRVRATAVAGEMEGDGTTVAARLLLENGAR